MKRPLQLLVALGLLFSCAACQQALETTIPVTGVNVSPGNLVLVIVESSKLSATVEPADATDKNVRWSSSNSSIAIVGSDGQVVALKEGSATITASAGGKTATCAVSVVSTYVEATRIALDKSSLDLVEGDYYSLTATIEPDNASNKYPEWRSSNSEVAVVDNEGKVVALKAGTATITAKVDKQTATCTVKVEPKILAVSRIILDKGSLGLVVGETFTLTATVEPDYATDKTVTWSSSNPSVATIADGLVTAITEGTATITATAGDYSATCEVTVYPPYEYVEMGLSVMWATCNLGANAPEEVGDYYAWGEIEPKESYNWNNYKWCYGGSSSNLTKYNTKNTFGEFVDHKLVLDPEDDAASITRGPLWHTPTMEEWEELRTECVWTQTTQNGISGYRVNSKTNDNSIFLEYRSYWSSSLNPDTPYEAWGIYYSNGWGWRPGYGSRDGGRTIRPVTK